jgi:hypothetical protein
MSRFTSTRAVAVGVLVAAVALTGCSSKKTAAKAASITSASSSASVAPESSAAASPVAGSSGGAVGAGLKGDPAAIALATSAVQSIAKLKSAHITGSVTDAGKTYLFDVQLASATGATGSVTFDGASVKLILLPTAIYLQADQKAIAAFLALTGGTDGPVGAQVAPLAGKWLKLADLTKTAAGATNPLDKIGSYQDFNALSDAFKNANATITMGDKKTINGESAQGLLVGNGSSGSGAVVYVQAGGAHLPVEIVPSPLATGATAGATGKIDFSDFNKSVSITAPAGAVDITPLLSGLFGGLGGTLAPSPSSS